MIALAGVLIRPGRMPLLDAVAIGVLGCLSVMFKVVGIFLAPLALSYFWCRPRRELLIAVSVAIVVGLPMILYFDLSFVARMFNRFREGASLPATGASLHASPWSLVPISWGIYARPIASFALVALTIAAYARGRIDLLNCCAGLCVVFTCLWLVGGSMDRMNVAMIFALICSATISAKAWAHTCAHQLPVPGPPSTMRYSGTSNTHSGLIPKCPTPSRRGFSPLLFLGAAPEQIAEIHQPDDANDAQHPRLRTSRLLDHPGSDVSPSG